MIAEGIKMMGCLVFAMVFAILSLGHKVRQGQSYAICGNVAASMSYEIIALCGVLGACWYFFKVIG